MRRCGSSTLSPRTMKTTSKYLPKKGLSPFQIRWNEPLGESHCPYAYRWVLNLHLFSIRLHNFVRSDDKRYFHDHPWNFITLILKGSYIDVSPTGRDRLTAGSLRYRRFDHKHYVDVPEGGFWSLVITGPLVHKWGFWVEGKFRRPFKYFRKWGHPPCDEQ